MKNILLFLIACTLVSCGIRVSSRLPASAFDTTASPNSNGDTRPVSFVLEGPNEILGPENIGLIVNDQDPHSIAVGEYYQAKRNIPEENVVNISFAPGSKFLYSWDFEPIRDAVNAAFGPEIQALAITWTETYKVECMSITSAFAFGFDATKYCSTPCETTESTNYYNSDSHAPLTDHGFRPAMVLAGIDVNNVVDLIDRAVSAEHTYPTGKGYLMRTTDSARSVRWYDLMGIVSRWSSEILDLEYIDNSGGSGSNFISDESDVLFYFTGLTSVPDLDTLEFVPGAVADHLTSYGGALYHSGGQMSILRFLEEGACGSYGTVSEPCNYTQKFPKVSVFLEQYYKGETLIEAYWKSVQMPGEGIFVGDPLTRPYGSHATEQGQSVVLKSTELEPGETYSLEMSDSPDGPYTNLLSDISVNKLSQWTAQYPTEELLPYLRLRKTSP